MVHHSRVNPTRKRLVSGSLFAILTLVGLAMPGAYVVETAGPAPEITGAQDGVDLLTLTGGKTYGTQTKYYMTTVSSYGNSDFGVVGAQAFAAIFSRDSQVLPVRSLYPAGQTADQVDKRNTALMGDSQQAAASTAETAAGLPVRMRIGVAGVPKGSPAAGRLREGDLVTSIVNGKDCVFTCYDNELCLCTFDRAHRAGRCSFRKPISCALYPIREKRFDDDLVGLNYHRWEVCKPAVKKGRELNLPLYRFLEGPLTERFGREWYAELCEVAESLKVEGEEGSKE